MPADPPPLDPREVRFLATDFERFHERIQRDPEFNDARLEIRRKLDAIGKHLVKSLATKDLELVSRASLHHPYKFNAFKVASQWVYLSRGDKERKAIVKHLGADLGKDLDQNYVHTILVLEIAEKGLETALRIHQSAWWDGENLKRNMKSESKRDELAAALRPLAGYGLRIGDNRRVRACPEIEGRDLAEAMGYYTPGDQWLHIARKFSRDDAFVTAPGLLERLEAEFRALLPAYRLMRWSKENDRLFGG